MIEHIEPITVDDVDGMELRASITCEFCSEVYSCDIDMMSDSSRREQLTDALLLEGWAMVETNEMVGVCCSDCKEYPELTV